uniref:RRM domain-containing protein n=1 Tax=Strigamia maritima TaxID=126957 RepID=T1IZB5_STRMM
MGTRIYIRGFDYNVCHRDIEIFFKGYGLIHEIVLKKGFAFVQFDNHRDADDAIYDLNGKTLFGQRVTVEFTRKPERSRDSGRGRGRGDRQSNNFNPRFESYDSSSSREKYRLIVENLSSSVSWQELKNHMRQAGNVTYAQRPNRDIGIVDFETRGDMENAIRQLDNSELYGRRIRLIEEKTGRNRNNNGSDSRSRPRATNYSRPQQSSFRSRSPLKSRSGNYSRTRSNTRSRSRSPLKSRRNSREKLVVEKLLEDKCTDKLADSIVNDKIEVICDEKLLESIEDEKLLDSIDDDKLLESDGDDDKDIESNGDVV